MGVEWLAVDEAEVPDSGDARFQLSLGGIFGVVRWRPGGWAEGGVEIGILAGFDGQFDMDRGYDNIGWDGLYGLMLSARGAGPANPGNDEALRSSLLRFALALRPAQASFDRARLPRPTVAAHMMRPTRSRA